MNWLALDTETTGFEEPQPVEIGVVRHDGMWTSKLVKPTIPITFGAMATHMITPDMLVDAPSIEDVMKTPLIPDDCVIVAHNAKFDKEVMSPYLQDRDWVCTWRCSLHLWPNSESHSNMSLWYERGLARPMPEAAGSMPHRALFDAMVTADIFREMLEERSIEQLVELSDKPVVLTKVRFGKHVNSRWEDVPKSYMRWCLTQDFDEDTLHTCRFWLATPEERREMH